LVILAKEKSQRRSKAVFLGILIVLGVSGSMWSERAEAQPGKKQSVRGGGVEVIAELLEEPANVVVFRVSLDTHVVNLDVYSFQEMVRLRDGRGGELPPTTIEGGAAGGHHRSAIVRFAAPDPKPKDIELIVKDVAGVSERVFRWENGLTDGR